MCLSGRIKLYFLKHFHLVYSKLYLSGTYLPPPLFEVAVHEVSTVGTLKPSVAWEGGSWGKDGGI